MSFLSLLFFGAIVGWLANMFVHNPAKSGLLGNIVLGMLGSIVGGWIMEFFNKPGVNGFNLYSIFVGMIGAIALITIFRLLGGDRK